MPNYVAIENLLNELEIPKDGTLSRTLHRDDRVKIVLFGFAGGQELRNTPHRFRQSLKS